MQRAVTLVRDRVPSEHPYVVELGSQRFTGNVPGIKTTPQFYTEALGFGSYDSIDFNDECTIKFDLNNVYDIKGKEYDLVTNNGTGEHIFNQSAVFETCHNLCRVGGVMLHALPWRNWVNHGFYNFQPRLFFDLAANNDYEILEMYGCDRNGGVLVEGIKDKEDKSQKGIDGNIILVVALKKTGAGKFETPTQGKYRGDDILRGVEQKRNVSVLQGMGEILDTPFPHAVGKLPDWLYNELRDAWPDKEKIVQGREGDNILLQWPARLSLEDPDLPPIWREFIEYHTSSEFFQELFAWCGKCMVALNPNIMNYPMKVGVRHRDKTPIGMEAQFCLDTPVIKNRIVRGMHVDNPLEFYKFLIRFPGNGYSSEGNLNIGMWSGKPQFEGKAEAVPGTTDVWQSVPNEGIVFFLNSIESLHGVSKRSEGDGFRRYFNLVGEVPDPIFKR